MKTLTVAPDNFLIHHLLMLTVSQKAYNNNLKMTNTFYFKQVKLEMIQLVIVIRLTKAIKIGRIILHEI